MQTIICDKKSMPKHLATGVFLDRRRQFIDRFNWDLTIEPSGGEKDEYDDPFSRYIIVNELDSHMGSCRIRPTIEGSMIEDHFSSNFPSANKFLQCEKKEFYELTRFCRSPDITTERSTRVIEELGVQLDKFKNLKGLAGFVAVVFPKVARLMTKIGMDYIILEKSVLNGNEIFFVCITRATPKSTNALRFSSGYAVVLEANAMAA